MPSDRLERLRALVPKRRIDLRGCKPCKDKMSAAMIAEAELNKQSEKESVKLCVYRGLTEGGITFCNESGELRMISVEECNDCKLRKW